MLNQIKEFHSLCFRKIEKHRGVVEELETDIKELRKTLNSIDSSYEKTGEEAVEVAHQLESREFLI